MNDDVERMVTTSFFLGLRISQAINNLPPPDRIRYAALMETLQSVAAGKEELTLEAADDLNRVRQSADFEAMQRDYMQLQQVIAKHVLARLSVPKT